MPDKSFTNLKAEGGYSLPRSAPLTESYVRKGGVNAPSAQATRPPPPPPLRPATGPNAPSSGGQGGSSRQT